MPSPFPGMDPYLEHPAKWSGVHFGLIALMQADLNAQLPPNYVAELGECLYVVPAERSIFPDLDIVRRRPAGQTPESGTGGTALLTAADPVWILTALAEERREPFIQIVTTDGRETVITVIELLSPSNKALGSPGRELYRTKQAELLASRIHLLEIDLLRRGEHTVAPPLERLQELGVWTYLVSLRRAAASPVYEVWPILLEERLPLVRVPLAGEDPDVVLDLQSCFDRRYDQAASARRIDYTAEPTPRLTPEQAAWADAWLREKGLRGGGQG